MDQTKVENAKGGEVKSDPKPIIDNPPKARENEAPKPSRLSEIQKDIKPFR